MKYLSKRLIINADDFGSDEKTNRAIIESHQKGVVTSVSLLVNTPGFEDAASLIHQNQGLSMGIHINIIRGCPVCPADKLKSLTNGGRFLGSIFGILHIIYFNQLDIGELEAECRAQIEKAIQKGVAISHIDSEKHLHLIEPVFKVIVKLAKEYGIKKIRNINEMPYLFQRISNPYSSLFKQLYKILLLNAASARIKPFIIRHQMKTPDYFYGVYEVGNAALKEYERIILNLRNGTTEIMCHPKYTGGAQELKALINPKLKELIRKLNINLISYKQL